MDQGGLAQYNNVYIVQPCFLVDVGEGREYKGELLYCTLRFISLPGVVTSICHWYLTHTHTRTHTYTQWRMECAIHQQCHPVLWHMAASTPL